MKINLPFFKCEIYEGGAWVRFGTLGGFSIVDREKHRFICYSLRMGNDKPLKIGKYTLHRLKP